MNQYTYHTTVLNADGDFRRMIKPSALFRYVEQAAADHARAYGMDDAFFTAHHTAFLVAGGADHPDAPARRKADICYRL